MPTGQITPLFRLVFFTVLGLTLLGFVGYMALLLLNPSSAFAEDFAGICRDMIKTGTAAIFGLIGGKAL